MKLLIDALTFDIIKRKIKEYYVTLMQIRIRYFKNMVTLYIEYGIYIEYISNIVRYLMS